MSGWAREWDTDLLAVVPMYKTSILMQNINISNDQTLILNIIGRRRKLKMKKMMTFCSWLCLLSYVDFGSDL